jgi:hypothetical protein
MANLDQVRHPPDVDDGSADSGASAPDEAVDAALVNIFILMYICRAICNPFHSNCYISRSL